MEDCYGDERLALERLDVAPALTALAEAHKRPGRLGSGAQALEDELISLVSEAWRSVYLTRRAALFDRRGQQRPRQLAGFLPGHLFPPQREGGEGWLGLRAGELEGLLERLRGDLRRELAGQRKLSEARLLAAQLASQRRGLAELLANRAPFDEENRAAARFLRAKDLPVLEEVYAARLGERKPLLTAFDAGDWEELLKIWLRGWRPCVEAVGIRLAARVDGAPRGGALDQITSY